jgi:hypothetical protein
VSSIDVIAPWYRGEKGGVRSGVRIVGSAGVKSVGLEWDEVLGKNETV